MSKQLRRSQDKKIAGVCGGLANYFDMDATIIRLIFLGATILTVGSPILIYAVLWIAMPE